MSRKHNVKLKERHHAKHQPHSISNYKARKARKKAQSQPAETE